MSCHRPFCRITLLAAFAVAANVLLTPAQILPARAQAAQQAALANGAKSDSVKSEGAKSDTATPAAPPITDAAAAADLTVVSRGRGAKDGREVMKGVGVGVLDMKPDLVIGQVGTTAVLRNLDPAETAKLVEEGIARIQAAGADLVLVDPQYSPKINERAESASQMVKLLGKVARLRHVGFFPRFEVMREWHEQQSIPIDNFVIADGLHMTDWGYACFAQLLGDDIIKSVGQIKLGVNVPSNVQTYRPM